LSFSSEEKYIYPEKRDKNKMTTKKRNDTLFKSKVYAPIYRNCLELTKERSQAGLETVSLGETPSAAIITLRDTLIKDVPHLCDTRKLFEQILNNLFDVPPVFVETLDGSDLTFEAGTMLHPLSDEAFRAAIDIHFALMQSPVPYDDFLFTNVITELERRTTQGDPKAHALLSHYDTLYHTYNRG
jgi:hypothetical protein